MGIVRETYHKGVPSMGVPGNTLDIFDQYREYITIQYRNIYSTSGINGLFVLQNI